MKILIWVQCRSKFWWLISALQKTINKKHFYMSLTLNIMSHYLNEKRFRCPFWVIPAIIWPYIKKMVLFIFYFKHRTIWIFLLRSWLGGWVAAWRTDCKKKKRATMILVIRYCGIINPQFELFAQSHRIYTLRPDESTSLQLAISSRKCSNLR